METDATSFWQTLPGVITAVAALITAVTGLVVALRRRARPSEPAAVPVAPPDPSGSWEGTVRYGWGATVTERFALSARDGRLTGRATFLGVARAVTGGFVRDDAFGFTLALEEMVGEERRPFELRYVGTVVDGGLHLRIEDSRGNPDVSVAADRA